MIRFILKNGSPIKEFVYDTNRLTMVKENDILYSSNQDENSIDLNNITPNILYDNYGNIIQTDKAHITYNSRNLMETYEINSNEKYLFTYNYQGVRCKKQRTAGSQYSVYYYLDGSRIMGEDSYGISGNTIHKFRYYYDVEGICGINYITSEGNHYYNLIKDSLGNVSKIMYRGKYIGEYIYDAWGNCEVRELSASNDLDRYALYYNPFRYKGYYYDVETQLYLVSSRYYSPELCRFIQSVDVSSLNPQSINGLNLYNYCNDNHVNIACSVSSGRQNIINIINNSYFVNSLKTQNFNWPNLDFLETGFSYIENTFSVIAGVIDGTRQIKNLDKLTGLEKASNWLMGIGIVINAGLSVYNNLTNHNLTDAQKAGNIIGDFVYIGVSCFSTWGVSALTAMIPYVGKFIAPIAGLGFGIALDQFWYGENILWIEGSSFNPKGKSIDEWIKNFLTNLFGG